MDWRKHWIIWVCVLAIFVAVAGALGPDFVAAVRSCLWRTAPCRIVDARVAQEAFSPTVTHYVLQVEFTYTYDGREYRSRRYTTGEHQGSTDAQVAEQAATRFRPGTISLCYVNPRRPEEAVLVRGRLWGGLMLLAPLAVVGLIAHEPIFAWLERRRRREHLEKGLPLSDANDALRPDGRLLLFGALGLVVGLFLLGFCVATPLQRWLQSRQWVECDARIVRCELNSRSGMHGPEYSVELLYEYEFGGRQLRSSRRTFGADIGEPVADLTSWVAAHPAGTRLKCLLNPEDPTEAVLEPKLNLGWIALALGCFMFAFGCFMIGKSWAVRRLRRLSGAALERYALGRANVRPIPLRVRPAPWLVAVGFLLLVPPLGLVGGWSLQKGVRAMLNRQGDIINLLYGAGAVVGAGACVVASWNYARRARRPRPVLRLNPATPRVGDSFQLEWSLPGARDSVAWLRLSLEGSEQAQVRHLIHGLHGPISEEKLQEQVFESLLLAQPEGSECQAGRLTATVPGHVMHSFRGAKCGVVWQLKTEFGRDATEKLEYKFPILILPERP